MLSRWSRLMHAFADWLIGVIESVPSWAVYLIAAGIVYLETALLIAGLVLSLIHL